MKFRLKITICMLWLLALAFGIGGSLLITLSFEGNFNRELQAALSSYKMVLNTLHMADENESGPVPNHSNLSSALELLNTQGGGWSAIRLGDGESVLFEDNHIGAELDFNLPENENSADISVIKDLNGKRHIRISAGLSTSGGKLRFDQCYDISDIYTQRDQQLIIYRRVFLAVVFISAILCWVLAYWLTKPLSELSKASKKFASGELSYRAKIKSEDEVGALTRDFNTMAQTLQNNISTIQEASARQEAFMGNFAHEMKNPMTSIIGYAELIRAQMLSESEQMDAANYIFSEGKRLESLSLKLLDMLVLKKNEIELQPAKPSQIVGSMVQHLERVYLEKGIVLRCRCEDGWCMLESDLVKSLLVNLLDNARKSMDKGGNIYVMSRMTEEGCMIKILDTGRGIPPQELHKITEAFYRVDKSRSRAQGGVGLGLALCNEIVRLHRGDMKFESRVGNGTCVTVELKGGRV